MEDGVEHPKFNFWCGHFNLWTFVLQ